MDSMEQETMIRLDLPASHKYLNVLGACISAMLQRVEGLKEPGKLAYDIELATHETCTNIVDHAYGGINGRIRVSLCLLENKRQFVVELNDTGRSFDMSTAQSPNFDEPQIRGYGLFLMHQLMDKVEYIPQPGNNRWRLLKQL